LPMAKGAAKGGSAGGTLKPVHALVGEDVFLQLQMLRELLALAPEGVQRIDADGETAELADVLDELRSFAMFSSAKMVIVRASDTFISRFRESLEKYVASPADNSTLVLRVAALRKDTRIYKLIASHGQVHDCTPPNDVVRWIIDRAKHAHQLSIGPEPAGVLADLVGEDLGRLDNELAKLALQTDGRVDAESISRTVAFQREQEMWDMTNEVASGNVTEALRRWRQLVQLDSSAEYRAVTWLTMWLEKVRKALALKRAGKRDYDIGQGAKIFPASMVAPFLKTASAIGESRVAGLIDLLSEIDYRSKSGLGEMTANVERFLLTVGASRAAR
jgi:DNA polymerase-3 subunit delta